jgi:hypothetical protein
MPLEVINTIFAGATFVVIAATAIAAVVQLRHLRASNQLSALVTILQDWQKPQMQGWVRFVREEMPNRLRDPEYLGSLGDKSADRDLHPWLHLCDYYEQLGAYIKFGLVDRRSFLDLGGANVVDFYRTVRPAIERARVLRGSDAAFENFEYLAVLGLEWSKRHPQGTYPARVPRFSELEP